MTRPEDAAQLVAVCKDLDLVWVWFYKDVAPTALKQNATMKIQNAFAIIIIAFCSGCTNPANLVKGWKSHDGDFDPANIQNFKLPGNNHFYYPPDQIYHFDQSIIDDYTAYAHSVWPKGQDFFISHIDYYEDGTGQHAVRIELEIGPGRKYVEYYLFYGKDNKRTKVMKGKSWRQFHM
jgi:hypothetical protein